jgi:hypothetical protein
VSGSKKHALKISNQFRDSLAELRKRYFENQLSLAESFDKELGSLIIALLENPRAYKNRLEPLPKPLGHQNPDWEFRKLEFNIDGLSGDPGQGRLMFFYRPKASQIVLFWVYTHEQYEGRPSNDELKSAFNIIRDDSDSW